MIATQAITRASVVSKRGFATLLNLNQEFPGVPSTNYSNNAAPASQSTTLPNGLKVVTSPLGSALSSCTVVLSTPSGSRQEGAGEKGAAALSKHMQFKSNKNESTLKVLRDMEDAGATPFTTASRTSLSQGYTCSPNASLSLLTKLGATPTFENWDVKDAKQYAAIDASNAAKSATQTLSELIFEAAYGETDTFYYPTVGGASRDGLMSYYTREVSPLGGATLSASGVEDHESFVEAAGHAFGASGARPESAAAQYVAGEARSHAILDGGSASLLAIGYNVSADAATAAVISQLLSGSGANVYHSGSLLGLYGAGANATDMAAVLKNLTTANFKSAVLSCSRNASFSKDAATSYERAVNLSAGAVDFSKVTEESVKKAIADMKKGGIHVASVGGGLRRAEIAALV